MSNINITVISDLIKYFATRKIEAKAKANGFIKRSDGKLEAATFVKAFTIGLWACKDASLSHVAEICEDIQEGLTITRQAIQQRLASGVELLKDMLKEAMIYSLRHSSHIYTNGVFSKFNNIYICDATYLTLPKKLKPFYRGFGGIGKSEAALKVQTMFNITTRSFVNFEIHPGVESDDSYLDTMLSSLQKDDLIIQDLGYFNKTFFTKVDNKGAFYLSRIHAETSFFHDLHTNKAKPLNIEEIFTEDKQSIDMYIYIGSKKSTRICVRLIAVKCPPEIINQRLRRANKNARGRSISKKQKIISSWNIVITNAPPERLLAQTALDLYKIRWQIEIIFKAWKSHLEFRNIAHGGKAQVECMLYGRLIVITLMTAIYSNFYQLSFYNTGRELSILKFFSLLKYKVVSIVAYINEGTLYILKLKALLSKIASSSLYGKRNRKTTLETIMQSNIPNLAACG